MAGSGDSPSELGAEAWALSLFVGASAAEVCTSAAKQVAGQKATRAVVAPYVRLVGGGRAGATFSVVGLTRAVGRLPDGA